jgi:hypothetical protein
MSDMYNVVSEAGEFPAVLFSSSGFDDCVRFIIDRDCDGTDFDIFIQDADGNIFGF